MIIFSIIHKIAPFLSRWKWILLGSLSLGIRVFADSTPQYVESVYSRGIYPVIRWIFDNSLGRLPFPLIYLFYGLMLYFIIKTMAYFFKKSIPLSMRLKENLFSMLSFAGLLVFGFLFLWGYNYARIPFHQQMKINITKLDTLSLAQELQIAASEAIEARNKLPNQLYGSQGAPVSSIRADFEENIRHDISSLLTENGFVAGGHLRGRSIRPEGILFRFGISGIYMPYVGESNIDDGMHDLEKPFTMAHEMAHGYGWTDEATANFIAYLTCINSDDAFFKYSGFLMYFRYVASNYRRVNLEAYKKFRETLPPSIINDLKAINARIQQFPTWFDTDGLNNIFLKTQGVKDGIASYSRVVTLVHSWRIKDSLDNTKSKILNDHY